MPTIADTTIRLSLNTNSSTGIVDDVTEKPIKLFKGGAAGLDCALFVGKPSAESLVSDIANITSIHFVLRKRDSRGTVLATVELGAEDLDFNVTYSDWVAGLDEQFTIPLSAAQTNQTVPASRSLSIYFAVYVQTSTNRYVAGFGYGQIIDVGITGVVEPPLPDTGFGFDDLADHPTTPEGYGMSNVHQTTRVVYASQVAELDANLITGGGTDDTAALEAVLATAPTQGRLELILDGVARVSTLKLRSNTTLRALEGCGAFQTSGSNVPLLQNFARGNQIVNPTQSDRNISLIGGTYNCNGANQSDSEFVAPPEWIGESWIGGLQMYGLQKLYIERVIIRNARHFHFNIGNATDVTMVSCRAEAIEFVNGSNDGIHLYGPILRFDCDKFMQIGGTDDAISLDCHFLVPEDPLCCQGSIRFVTIRNTILDGSTGGRGFRLLTAPGFNIDHLLIKGVTGTANFAHAMIMDGGQLASGPGVTLADLGAVTIEDWELYGPWTRWYIHANALKLVLKNVLWNYYGTDYPPFAFGYHTDNLGNSVQAPDSGVIEQLAIIGCGLNRGDGVVSPINSLIKFGPNVTVRHLNMVGIAVDKMLQVIENRGVIDTLAASNFTTRNVTRILHNLGTVSAMSGDAFDNPSWVATALANSWVDYGSGEQTSAYYKDGGNRVWLRGNIKNGTTANGTVVFTLAPGYRPTAPETFIVVSGGALARVYISTSGTVQIYGASSTDLHLSGISFRTT